MPLSENFFYFLENFIESGRAFNIVKKGIESNENKYPIVVIVLFRRES
jgi:hypothetical protein